MDNLQAIILAAGKSVRFNTGRTKLLEKICGQEMILFPIKLLRNMSIPVTLVLGHQKKQIVDLLEKNNFNDLTFAYQAEQLGTGHALSCARPVWNKDNILIMNGDMPLVNSQIIEDLYVKHIKSNSMLSFVVAQNIDPSLMRSYGKVIKDETGIRIIEAKDYLGETMEHSCINAGIYIIKRSFLREGIEEIKSSNAAHEFYLTDLIKIASDKKYTIETIHAPFDLIRGVNDLKELWAVEQIKRSELISKYMAKGVRFSFAQNVHLDLDIDIGAGTVIYGDIRILRGSKIGRNCHIDSFSIIENSIVGDNSRVNPLSIIQDSKINSNSTIGPFVFMNNQSSSYFLKKSENFSKVINNVEPFIAAVKTGNQNIKESE